MQILIKGCTQRFQTKVINDQQGHALLTGQRPADVLKLKRTDIRDGALWSIQNKTGARLGIEITGELAANSDTGHLTEPNHPHSTACKVAGIDGLTLHGLRRSFKSLTEWLEVPAGVVAHDPFAYLKDVLTRLPTQRASQVGELLPHRWQQQS